MPASKNPELSKRFGGSHGWLMAHKGYTGDECLIWPFSVRNNGYGAFGHRRKIYHAHRFMCEIAHGAPPSPKHHAAHSCNVRNCVNPRHLSWKTQSENEADKQIHGTAGRANGSRTKLSYSTIEFIRAMRGMISQEELAMQLGVPYATIRYWQKTTHAPAPPGKARLAAMKRRAA
jgi:DNA-binding transcriptional regulator YiaG